MPQDLLPYLSGLLQWARAREKFSEWWYAGIVVGAAMLFYALGDPQGAFAKPWDVVLKGWWDNVIIILAMTQGVSTTANLIHESSRKPDSPTPVLIPVTNSQP